MTAVDDPTAAEYIDEAGARGSLSDGFDVCVGCRLCTELCTVFPTLFDLLDRREMSDAGMLTPAEQDAIAAGCVQCGLCTHSCPYAPGRDPIGLDLAARLLRHQAMRWATGQVPRRQRRAARVLGRADVVGRTAVRFPALANAVTAASPGSRVRAVVGRLLGISPTRPLSPFARLRLSTWFARRPGVRLTRPQADVTVVPTCLVEYQAPGVGRDLIAVLERNGVQCTVRHTGCCGAPSLHAGDLERFRAMARANVRALAAEVRAGRELVVTQPVCSDVVRVAYPTYVAGPESDLVAARTSDPAELLLRLHLDAGTRLDTEFAGDVPRTIAYHSPCRLRTHGSGSAGRDLLRLTGARVQVIRQCAGVDSMWALRAGADAASAPLAERLAALVVEAHADVVAGDCHLANTVVTAATGRVPAHPVQVLARAYGIPEEGDEPMR